MNTLQLIYFICTNPQFKTVVIDDFNDKTPLQAIEYLSGTNDNSQTWTINTVLIPGVLLVF